MTTVLDKNKTTLREYDSGDIVEPGTYIDVETGNVVQIHERDELPDGTKVVHYRRRFRRLDGSAVPNHN